MAKVLVTGANGFLGSWLVKKLIAEQHSVVCLVRPSSDLSELEGVDCEYRHGDVTDISSLEKHSKDIDTIFHLAGVIAYKASDRALMDKVNIGGTQNVVNVVKKNNVRKLVYLSSVVAIGAGLNDQQILNEKSEFNIHHLNLGYFETKHLAEKVVVAASNAGEIQSAILNPSTIYGAGDARKGSRKTQLKVAQGKFPFYTSGGVNIVGVEDVVSGILQAWQKAKNGERYILSGENIKIKQLFEMIATAAGVEPPKLLMPTPALHTLGFLGDLATKCGLAAPFSSENAWTSTLYHWFDSTKAQKELGFTFQPAKKCIENSIAWVKQEGLVP